MEDMSCESSSSEWWKGVDTGSVKASARFGPVDGVAQAPRFDAGGAGFVGLAVVVVEDVLVWYRRCSHQRYLCALVMIGISARSYLSGRVPAVCSDY